VTEPLRGRWFDGRSSQARPVLVALKQTTSGPTLRLHDLAMPSRVLELTGNEVAWPQAWSAGRTPRVVTIDLREHGSLEIDDGAQWHAALAAAGGKPALAQRMQTRWGVFLVVLLVAAAGLGAFYRWGTPWAATQVTRQVPMQWETALAQRALADLDSSWLKPSKLPPERQAQLRARFDALAKQVEPGMQRYAGYAPALSLSFRSGLGANAFALPGGAIVMTDAMVEGAARQGLGDDALVGVLAHEIGHVVHRHTTRIVVEQAVLNVGLGLALGDVSSLVSIGGSLLTGLAYRRNHETEADCFAAVLMRKAQLPVAPMAELLLGMEHERDVRATAAKKASAPAPESSTLGNLLSSHPATAARAQMFKDGKLEGCQAASH
jgi:Zn-dependent protease with chaperone function